MPNAGKNDFSSPVIIYSVCTPKAGDSKVWEFKGASLEKT